MKRKLKEYLKRMGLKGRVRNHSSKDLWVIESTTNHPNGPPIAHILKPGMKSPAHIDADGFRRLDGKAISGHSQWWKITDISTADVFNKGSGLLVAVAYKSNVGENHFGAPKYVKEKDWGTPINYIVDVERGEDRSVLRYLTSQKGWLEKDVAIESALKGEVDLVVVVKPFERDSYLRSFPGQPNFGDMG